MDIKKKYSEKIKQKALALGFDACGIVKATNLGNDSKYLKKWLEQDFHGEMKYMENHFEKRIDPTVLVPGAKSIISVILNYYPIKLREKKPVISKYAYGEDYHFVIKRKLKDLYSYIDKSLASLDGRVFVDSAPVLERAWAAQAGLGWIGKNSMLISPEYGSFIFIGSIICNLKLSYDQPIKEHCGNCTKCINSCPTKAIINPKIIDSNKCISYLTIEYKSQIPEKFKSTFRDQIFGCDICQDVCPWNKKVQETKMKEFTPSDEFLAMNKSDFQNLDDKNFLKIFKKSAIKRVKYENLIRNIKFNS